MNTGLRYDLNLMQGSPFEVELYIKSSPTTYLNLSGYTGHACVKYRYSSGVVANLDVIIITPESGHVNLSMPSTGTAALPSTKYLYDFELRNGNTTINYLYGYLNVYPDLC